MRKTFREILDDAVDELDLLLNLSDANRERVEETIKQAMDQVRDLDE